MNLTGKIKQIGETQTFGSNGFKKRELVLTTEEQYPQDILIEFVQDKTELLRDILPNHKVKIDINIRGREWVNPQGETKYFNSIQGWRIEEIKQIEEQARGNDIFEPATHINDDDHDDLPF